jgi:hypothetical protein
MRKKCGIKTGRGIIPHVLPSPKHTSQSKVSFSHSNLPPNTLKREAAWNRKKTGDRRKNGKNESKRERMVSGRKDQSISSILGQLQATSYTHLFFTQHIQTDTPVLYHSNSLSPSQFPPIPGLLSPPFFQAAKNLPSSTSIPAITQRTTESRNPLFNSLSISS